jgi:hypothetical protein
MHTTSNSLSRARAHAGLFHSLAPFLSLLLACGASPEGSSSSASRPLDAGAASSVPADASLTPAGGHCGGNMTVRQRCDEGLECVPLPRDRAPFGDVGGVCAARCDLDGSCPTGETCAYPTREACGTRGFCLPDGVWKLAPTPAGPTASCCKCDGTTGTDDSCADLGGLTSYAPWPVDHAGACDAGTDDTDPRDAQGE